MSTVHFNTNDDPDARAAQPRSVAEKQIRKYDLVTLWQDLSAHLVFGTATAAANGVLARRAWR